jgi:hypothetical protein
MCPFAGHQKEVERSKISLPYDAKTSFKFACWSEVFVTWSSYGESF